MSITAATPFLIVASLLLAANGWNSSDTKKQPRNPDLGRHVCVGPDTNNQLVASKDQVIWFGTITDVHTQSKNPNNVVVSYTVRPDNRKSVLIVVPNRIGDCT